MTNAPSPDSKQSQITKICCRCNNEKKILSVDESNINTSVLLVQKIEIKQKRFGDLFLIKII